MLTIAIEGTGSPVPCRVRHHYHYPITSHAIRLVLSILDATGGTIVIASTSWEDTAVEQLQLYCIGPDKARIASTLRDLHGKYENGLLVGQDENCNLPPESSKHERGDMRLDLRRLIQNELHLASRVKSG